MSSDTAQPNRLCYNKEALSFRNGIIVAPYSKSELLKKINEILKEARWKGIEYDEKQTKNVYKRLKFKVSSDVKFDLGRADAFSCELNKTLRIADNPKYKARCASNNHPSDLKCFYLGLMDLH